MDCYSRDFLCRFGMGDATAQEQGAPRVEMEDVELSLGLSLGGRFGLDRKREMLVRSSSVAAMLTLPVVVTPPPPPALPRTSSLPVEAEASEGGIESGAVRVEDAARRPSGSPSSGSSDAEEHGLQGTLIRTGSLPAGIEAVGTEELRKRKAAQSLKRLEVKKKRIERKNSLSNVSKEAVGQIAGEINANAEKSQCSLSAAQKKPNSAFKGTAMAEEHSSSSSTQSPGSAKDASPPLPARAVALGSWGGQQNISGGAAARAGSAGDLQRRMMKEMPGVFYSTTVNRVDGFLYDYRKGAQLRIVCLCHGNFLTPAEFIEHAGAAEVENPLQHIVVNEGQNL